MRVIKKIGNEKLLEKEKTLFLCSKKAPYDVYPAVFNWVESLSDKHCIICFKSSQMEYEVMTSLLVNKIPTILVIMNKFTDIYNLQIKKALKENRMLILIMQRDEPRGLGQTPRLRNEYIVRKADKIICGYVNPNGSVFSLLAGRKNVEYLTNNNAQKEVKEQYEKKDKCWTVAEDKTLLRMFYEDKGLHAIKKQLRKTYSSVMKRISAITLPEEMIKGREFEDFVLNELLVIGKDNDHKLLEWRGDKTTGSIFPESNRYPDFVISLCQGKKVSLECKWRMVLNTNLRKDIFSDDRIEIFRIYNAENSIPVWFIIGVGGEPSAPKTLYLVPLSAVNDILANKRLITEFICNAPLTIDDFTIK